MYRPRDIIVFFNCCIDQAVDRPRITATALRQAEGDYSRRRYRSLGDEWYADYPELLDWAELLKEMKPTFRLQEIESEQIAEKCLDVCSKQNGADRELRGMAMEVIEERMSIDDFRVELARVFYRVGLVGLKVERFASVVWSYTGDQIIKAL